MLKSLPVRLLGAVLLSWVSAGQAQTLPESLTARVQGREWRPDRSIIRFCPEDSAMARRMIPWLVQARGDIIKQLGHDFPDVVNVTLLPSREAFDAVLKEEWGMPATQPWMVAAGVADFMLMLTPRVWNEEAEGHDPDDETHVREIIIHELVHVFHGQVHPTRDFTGVTDLDWLIEGVAVLISGQLDNAHCLRLQEAIEKCVLPDNLDAVWTGPYRYALAGSLVRFIQEHYGSGTLYRILKCRNRDEVLTVLEVNEEQLIKRWQGSLAQ